MVNHLVVDPLLLVTISCMLHNRFKTFFKGIHFNKYFCFKDDNFDITMWIKIIKTEHIMVKHIFFF